MQVILRVCHCIIIPLTNGVCSGRALKELGGNNFRDIGIDSQSLEAKTLNENLP